MSISALYPVLFPMDLLSMEPWAAAKKTFIQCGGAPNVASVTSIANDKGDNKMILGAVHRSPDICLTAEENPGKPQLGDHLMKGLCDQSSSQMGSLPPNDVGTIAHHVRKGEGRK